MLIVKHHLGLAAWTNSEDFRKAHARAGDNSSKKLFIGHLQFEGFEAVQTLTAARTGAAA